jgi:tubulin--tyrosine ligase
VKRSFIIQKYIERPLLYKNRKFDIRTFALMCSINGNLQGYWYQEGYLRTSCREFTLKNVSNRYVHLTNDAVQKRAEDYGKFESGNKLAYTEFQKYLDSVNIKCDFV